MRIALYSSNVNFMLRTQALITGWHSQFHRAHVYTFSDGESLIAAHVKAPFDVIFIDLDSLQHSGIAVTQEIRQQDHCVKIGFLASSGIWAIPSYQLKVSNYLPASVSLKAILQCLDELASELERESSPITIHGIHTVFRLPPEWIEYVEAQNKHIHFMLTNGQAIESPKPLHRYSDQLLSKSGFFPCHRSYVVNLHHVIRYTSEELTMRSGAHVPVSRSCSKKLCEQCASLLFPAGSLHLNI